MSTKSMEPQFIPSKLNTPMLNYKTYIMSGKEKTIYFLAAFIAGGIVGLIFYGGLFKDEDGSSTVATLISNIVVYIFAGLIAAKVYLPMRNEQLRKKRISVLVLQFRSFLEAISISLSSGMNMNDALVSARKDMKIEYSEDAYIVSELNEIISGMQNGLSIESMMLFWGDRSGIVDIKNFANVFSIANRVGGNLKDVIRRTNQIISEKIEISQEIETAITSNKSQFSAMMIVPIVIVLLMRVMSSQFAAGFATISGVIAITAASGLFIAAYKVGQKIMNISG